jgi:hypothetical protein
MNLREWFSVWPGTEEEFLQLVNSKDIKVVTHGRVSIAGVGKYLGDQMAAMILLTLDGAIAAMRSAGQVGEARLVESFKLRFETSDDGVDFTDEAIRSHLTQICASWPPEQLAALLALGYVMKSAAEIELGRDATQEDIDGWRFDAKKHDLLQLARQRLDAYETKLRDWDGKAEAPEL